MLKYAWLQNPGLRDLHSESTNSRCWRIQSANVEARIERLKKARLRKSEVGLFDARPMSKSLESSPKWKNIGELLENGAHPVEILKQNVNKFWDLVVFLNTHQRFDESLQVYILHFSELNLSLVFFLQNKPKAFEWWRTQGNHQAEEEDFVKLMIMASEAGKPDAAQQIFDEMEDQTRSLVSFNALVQAYAAAGKMEEAEKVVKQMLETGLKPNVSTYTQLISGYGRRELYDEMTRVFNTMKTVQCRPDFFAYKHLIEAYSRGGLVGRMEKVFKDLLADGWKADPETLNFVGQGFASMGVIDKMEQLQAHMKRKKIFPRRTTIHSMALAYTRKNYFYQMGQFAESLGVNTNENPGTLLGNMLLLSSAANFSMKKLQRDFQGLTAQTEFQPDLTTFNIRALAFSRMQMFWDLHILVRHIHSSSITPDLVTFGALVDAYVDGRLTEKLSRALDELQLLEMTPDVRTDALVFEAFGRGKFHVFSDEFMRQNPGVKYSTLVTCYFEMLREKFDEQNQRRWRYKQRYSDIWQ